MLQVTELPAILPRARDTHKGTYGRVLLIAGSRLYPGAVILAARAALRAGAGLVTAAVPGCVSAPLAAACPECTHLIAEDPAGLDWTARYSAVAVGPGLGQDARAQGLLRAALEQFGGPLVLDADALNLIAKEPRLASPGSSRRIWTPHPGELERLTGEECRGQDERLASAERFTESFQGVLVLKGHRTIVAEKGRYFVNPTGNPGMATAGAGDVLTGIIASLAGRGFEPFDAAILGVYLHGLAGDIAAERLGEESLTASDITDHLSEAIRCHSRPVPQKT